MFHHASKAIKWQQSTLYRTDARHGQVTLSESVQRTHCQLHVNLDQPFSKITLSPVIQWGVGPINTWQREVRSDVIGNTRRPSQLRITEHAGESYPSRRSRFNESGLFSKAGGRGGFLRERGGKRAVSHQGSLSRVVAFHKLAVGFIGLEPVTIRARLLAPLRSRPTGRADAFRSRTERRMKVKESGGGRRREDKKWKRERRKRYGEGGR